MAIVKWQHTYLCSKKYWFVVSNNHFFTETKMTNEQIRKRNNYQFHGLHLLQLVLEDLDVSVRTFAVVHLLDVKPNIGQSTRPK